MQVRSFSWWKAAVLSVAFVSATRAGFGADVATGRDPSARGVRTPPLSTGNLAPATPRALASPPGIPQMLSLNAAAAKERANLGVSRPTTKPGVTPPSANPASRFQQAFGANPSALGGSFLADTAPPPPFLLEPDISIAAGNNHVIVVTNSRVRIFDKQGHSIGDPGGDLCGFFNQGDTPLCDLNDQYPATSPSVMYDEYEDRFWIVASSVNFLNQTSHLLVAVSDFLDPTTGWFLFKMDAKLTGNDDSGNWCNGPKMGYDVVAVYFTCDMWNFGEFGSDFQYAKLRAMTKKQFTQGGDPDGLLWVDWWNSQLCEGGFCLGRSKSIQPARTHHDVYKAGIEFEGGLGEYLINANDGGGSQLVVRRVSHVVRCCTPGNQSFPILDTAAHDVGSYDVAPAARQAGTTVTIDTGDASALYAVVDFGAGTLSTGQNIACHNPPDACVAFTELTAFDDPRLPLSELQVLNDWYLDAPAGVDHFYPAVDINNQRDKTMVYSISSAGGFAGAAFVGIPSKDTCRQCVDGPETSMQDGQNSYVAQQGNGKTNWGRYSGAAIDPDGTGIWIAGEFASGPAPPQDPSNLWGVQVGISRDATFPNPVPHIDSISPSSATIRSPGFTLTVTGSHFISSSVVQWDGQILPNQQFVSDTQMMADVPTTDLQAVGQHVVTVSTPRPGGGPSNGVNFNVLPLLDCQGPGGKLFTNAAQNQLWQTANNWNPPGVPGPSDNVCILGNFAVTLSAGTQSINALDDESTGLFTISGGSLTVSGNSTVAIGGLTVNGGVFSPNGGLDIFGPLTLSGSYSTGLAGSGTVNANGTFTWAGADIAGSGNFNANGPVSLNGPEMRLRGMRQLNNAGNATWSGGTLYFYDSAAWKNLPGAVLDVQGDFWIWSAGCLPASPCTVSNAGIIRKSKGTGETRIGTGTFFGRFDNSGTLDVQTGTVNLLTGSGSNSGTMTVEAGATLSFGNTYTLAAAGSLSGPGTVNFVSGTVDIFGPYSITGNTNVSGGTANFNSGSITSLGQLGISGGTANFNSGAPIMQTTFTLSNGLLTGSDPFTVTGLFTWTGGDIGGPFTANGPVTLSGNDKRLRGMYGLTNTGTATWTSGTIYLYDMAIWNNQAGALLDVQADLAIGYGGCSPCTFLNSGTLQRSVGTGTIRLWSFQQNASGALNMKIGGRQAGQYDQIAVSLGNSAALDGTLNVSLLGGFTPVSGDSFTIVTAGSVMGAFAAANLPPLPGGLMWNIQYGPSSVILMVQ